MQNTYDEKKRQQIGKKEICDKNVPTFNKITEIANLSLCFKIFFSFKALEPLKILKKIKEEV
jgi:hypothetical protein